MELPVDDSYAYAHGVYVCVRVRGSYGDKTHFLVMF